MNLKILGFCLLLFFISCSGENSKLEKKVIESFEEEKKVTIVIVIKAPFKNTPLIIYEPINNDFNIEFYLPQNKIDITKDTTIYLVRKCYEPNTYILQYGIARAVLNLFPSDSVIVALKTKSNEYEMNFSGTDSIFHKKYNESAYSMFKDKTFDSVIPSKPDSPYILISKIGEYITKKTSFLDSIYDTKGISSIKLNYYKKLYAYSIASISTGPISMYYNENKKLNQDWFDKLYTSYPPFDLVSLKCLYGNLYIYNYLYDIETKRTKVFNGKYDSTWKNFSYYSNYGYAPDSIQKTIWGGMLITLIKSKRGEIDINQAFDLYTKKFPNSAYIPIIQKLTSKKSSVFYGQFIISKPNTLKELWEQNFKGNDVFIDLWATWCSPCTEEFQYKDSLESYLKSKNIKMLYLSMDESKDKVKWEKAVRGFELNSYNILVNDLLKKDILKNIYKAKEWSIPRYILIDKNGLIALKEAFRPSDGKILYEQINNTLK